jgi:hypothetical protein
VPQEELEPEAAEILGLETGQVTAVINTLEQSDFIKREKLQYNIPAAASTAVGEDKPTYSVREEQAVYLTPFYYSEVGLTRRLQQLIAHPTSRLTTCRQAMSRWQLPTHLAPSSARRFIRPFLTK